MKTTNPADNGFKKLLQLPSSVVNYADFYRQYDIDFLFDISLKFKDSLVLTQYVNLNPAGYLAKMTEVMRMMMSGTLLRERHGKRVQSIAKDFYLLKRLFLVKK